MRYFFDDNIKGFRWLVLLVLPLFAFAQPGNPSYSLSTNTFFELEIKPIAILDIETSQATTNFAMNVSAPAEAGEGFGTGAAAINSDNWINYSNGVPPSVKRKILISVSNGTVPAGFELQVSVGSATGSGVGVLGTPAVAPLTLTTSPQDLIVAIRGAYTGDGAGNGHQLTFSLTPSSGSFSSVEGQTSQVTVLYTLMDY